MSFHDKVIYQIYPKSFQDSDGNGVGDLRGVIDRIPYLAELGPDMVWLSPFFVSPQRDNGYDVADYRAVDPTMGTIDDLQELIDGLAGHRIGVMFDMVFNHTSTEHEWFRRALAGEERFRDYYLIRPPAPDGGLPNNWESKFGGPAWSKFGDTGDYYLHLFDRTQADLNWRNPEVRQEMADIVNFWIGHGVTGFRFDVINLIGKEEQLRSSPKDVDPRVMYTDGEDVETYLRELHDASFGRLAERITVGEMSSTSIQACAGYSHPDNQELDMVFSFHHLKVDYPNGQKWALAPVKPDALKLKLHEWAEGMQTGGGWNALFLNNHDQPRSVCRFGDPAGYRAESATMLATITHLLRGTPFIYMGEEIGMTDPEYDSITDYADIEALNAYDELIRSGHSAAEAFRIVSARARDNARTPMQWDSSPGAGFTTGNAWLSPTNQDRINVATELSSGRIFRHYQRLIRLRHEIPDISAGSYRAWALEHPSVYAYLRDDVFVAGNLTSETTTLQIPEEFDHGEYLINNYPGPNYPPTSASLTLRPYEALALSKGETTS
ncbi:alpha,alpha-phosphotrehalase [Corynebacterium alimapuense]|uniref:Alpha,alpha-phosphotrehalase n=1 Tax=Corynebacterium alimapuense TaxID=1576874 RepID=A0A3M8K6Y7_9CORY|nr:alpha,alpha-phosphotrehalase [Corynebacterium alimapuense]RNE48916.1 alpha,alpha-phosphotrehalase [Corynebacterium alimapuense]